MTRIWRVLALITAVGACEGRELAVFDVSSGAPTGGSALSGSGGSGGTGGSGATGGSGGAVAEVGGGGASLAGTSAGGNDVTAGGGAGGSTGGGGNGGDSSSSGGGSGGCVGDFDCDGGWLCEKRGCDEPFGECVPWPAICERDPDPVCGCDGVTYWNDCVRLSSRSHPQLAGKGQCRANACTCNVGSDCKVPYASCSHLMAPGESCGHGTGSCWVLPPRCYPSNDDKVWRECRPPDQPPPPFCVDTCLAIRSERPHVELSLSEDCN
jgi:hypothetical protein